MRRKRQEPTGPDTSFQIPAADLVTEPTPPSTQLWAELEEFDALVDLAQGIQEKLGSRALRLVEGLTQMLARGETDPDLEAQIIGIVRNLPLIQQLVKNGPLTSVTVTDTDRSIKGNTVTETETAPNCAKLAPHSLAEYLESRGFRDAPEFIRKHGIRLVMEATLMALDKPPGSVGNFAAYVQGIVAKKTAAAKPKPRGLERYLGGKYGHIVQH